MNSRFELGLRSRACVKDSPNNITFEHTQSNEWKSKQSIQSNRMSKENELFIQSRRSRGYCFVYFEQLDDATTAKESCANLTIDSRRVRVDYSITQRAHTPTPGIYKGHPIRRRHFRERDDHRSYTRSSRPTRYGRSYRRSRSHSPRERKYILSSL